MRDKYINYIIAVVILQTVTATGISQTIAPLNIGSSMPNIDFLDIRQNGKKIKFSTFNNKLIVLDFWSVNCGSCISEFDRMRKLQAEFEGKIQVILVTADDQKEVSKFVRNYTKKKPLNFPMIVNDTLLRKYFPHYTAGCYVWIDSNNKIRLIGISKNNTSKKIAQLLNGEQITFISNYEQEIADNRVYLAAKSKGLVDDQISFTSTTPIIYSQFSHFSEKAGDPFGESFKFTDTIRKEIKTSLFNFSVLQFYQFAYLPFVSDDWITVINNNNRINTPKDSRIQLHVKNAAIYSPVYLDVNSYTDEWMRVNQFCYEQLIRLKDSAQMFKIMQQDINRFFGMVYGIEGKIEAVKISCYSIRRRLDVKQLKSTSLAWSSNDKKIGSKELRSIKYADIRDVFSSMFSDFDSEYLVFDDTNITSKVDMTFEKGLKNIRELHGQLLKYGLEIVEEDRVVEKLIIRDTSN